ncbi:MAG: hypothetical protein LBG96_02445 [Tannerella sp.]|jgi:hypothetical protein|nr:hypothetical protein [Tannerella sp.]
MNTAVIIKPGKKESNSDTETNIDAMREYAKRKGIPVEEVNGKDPAYLEFLKKLEEFEDEYLVKLIEEGLKTKRVSRDRIFAILNR